MIANLFKVKNLNVIFENPIFGNAYHKFAMPLVYGEILKFNTNMIYLKYKDEEYAIRVDKSIQTGASLTTAQRMDLWGNEIANMREELKAYVESSASAGQTLFKRFTDLDVLEDAIVKVGSYKKDGIGLVIKHIAKSDEESYYTYSIDSTYKSLKFETKDVNEAFLALGTLSRIYLRSGYQAPDPKWNFEPEFPF